jgi:hypothetical protein
MSKREEVDTITGIFNPFWTWRVIQ